MNWPEMSEGNFVKIALFSIIFLQFIVFCWWSNNFNEYVPLYDQLYYLKTVKMLYDELLTGNFNMLFSFLGGTETKLLTPVFPFIMILPFYMIFGVSINLFLALNFVSLTLTTIVIYKLGKYVKDEKTGILASAIFSTFPTIYWFSKFFFMEFLALPFIVTSVYFLLRSNKFNDRKYSILFGMFSLFSIIVKNVSWLVLLPSFVFVFFKWKLWENKKSLNNYLISCLGYFCGAIFYFRAFTIMQSVSIGNLATVSQSVNIGGVIFYMADILSQVRLLPKMLLIHIGPHYFLLFIASLVIFILNRKKLSQELKMCFYVFLISYVILSSYQFLFFSNYSNPAYLNPHIRPGVLSLPFLAVMVSFSLFSIERRDLKCAILTALILFSYIYMIVDLKYNFLYGDMIKNQNLNPQMTSGADRYINFSGEDRGFILNITELESLFEFITKNGGLTSCITIGQYNEFSGMIKESLEFLFLKNDVKGGCELQNIKTAEDAVNPVIIKKIRDADIVVVSESQRYYPGWEVNKEFYEQFKNNSGLSEDFTLLRSFNITTKSFIVDVYKNERLS